MFYDFYYKIILSVFCFVRLFEIQDFFKNEIGFISVIFCEAVAIYGVIVAIILQTKLESVPSSQIYAAESLRAGYAIFASGIIVGFANLVCGYVCLIYSAIIFLCILWITISSFFLTIHYCPQAMCWSDRKQLCIV